MWLHRVTMGYWGYKGLQGGDKGLQRITKG